ALHNVAKHSHAASVWVELHSTKTSISGSVKDDGVGFDPALIAEREPTERGNLGLASMRVRAVVLGGSCEISSTPGLGTKVSVTIPIAESSW
ncbi:MAG: ATP-binding protein, partial [Candidatus Nanopelagicales bacterium]|nr:ATP-binding protein [Candidatus Nanopelagicales bacterium]